MGNLAGGRWILLRGVAGDAGHWGSFIDAWRAQLPAAEILQPDLPGCGLNHAGLSPLSVDKILENVRETVMAATAQSRASGDTADRPTAIFAVSLGAMVAYEWLRRHPGELAGAVLVNSSLGGLSAPWVRLRAPALWAMLRAATAPDGAAREARILSLVSARPDKVPDVVPSWLAIAEQRPMRSWNAVRQLVAASRYRARGGTKLDASCLVLAGRGDKMVNPACSRALAAAIGADLREHPTAGHDLPLDDPEWVAAEVADWVKSRKT